MDRIAIINVSAQRDEAFRAIGRYTVLFSMLVAGMRQIAAHRIAGQKSNERRLIDLAFGSLTAGPIADAFFGMCRELANLDKDERAIEKRLRKHVLEEINMRNDIAHGDWLIAEWAVGKEATPSPKLVRVKASRQNKPFAHDDLSVEQLDEIGTRVEALGDVVWEFGAICTGRYTQDPPRRVRDALEIDGNGRVVFKPGVERMPSFYEM